MEAFRGTSTADSSVLLILDDEDPNLESYKTESARLSVEWAIQDGHNLITGLNFGYRAVSDAFAVGFMGDDHRPITVGWDTEYLKALADLGTGIVYGNDLLQGEALPTQVAMTADIPRAVGFFAPPGLVHLYCDDYWKALGEGAGCLKYLPCVTVRHIHPATGEIEWDAHHRRVNAPEMYVKDSGSYRAFRIAGGLQMAVDAVRGLREP